MPGRPQVHATPRRGTGPRGSGWRGRFRPTAATDHPGAIGRRCQPIRAGGGVVVDEAYDVTGASATPRLRTARKPVLEGGRRTGLGLLAEPSGVGRRNRYRPAPPRGFPFQDRCEARRRRRPDGRRRPRRSFSPAALVFSAPCSEGTSLGSSMTLRAVFSCRIGRLRSETTGHWHGVEKDGSPEPAHQPPTDQPCPGGAGPGGAGSWWSRALVSKALMGPTACTQQGPSVGASLSPWPLALLPPITQ